MLALGPVAFFFWRWFGVFPFLPRFFLIARRVFLGFFMTFPFLFLLYFFLLNFFNTFCFLLGGWEVLEILIGVGVTFSFFRESYMVVLRGMQMVT